MSELMMREMLPKKDYFNCLEVCNLLKVKSHELRYWESEFSQIRIKKTKSGKRIYSKDDVVTMSAIKHLLHEKKFTLEAAKQVLFDSDFLSHAAFIEEPAHDEDKLCEEVVANQQEDILQSAAALLEPLEETFDEVAHEIYQTCGEELAAAQVEVSTEHLGEMIADGMAQSETMKKCEQRETKLEYEKTLGILMASRESLTELLASLDRLGDREIFLEKFDKK